jgi:hypothetical protein
VARGGHGGGLSSVTATAKPALLHWRWKKRPVGPGGPKGQVGRLAVGPIGPEDEKKFFQNKNRIFEFTKALQICTRKFRRNLDTRIFPKFF